MEDHPPTLTPAEADRFRAYERQRHDALANGYLDFFAPVTAQAIGLMLDAVHLASGSALLDVATGPGGLAAEATERGACAVAVDLSPGMIATRIPRSRWQTSSTCRFQMPRSTPWSVISPSVTSRS